MVRKIRFTLLWLVILLALSGQMIFAQSDSTEFFPEIGHYVVGDFHDFYFANPDARLVYGLPITDEYIDPQSGLLIQYFEKVRFEYHPESPPGERIKLTPLGVKTLEHGDAIQGLTASTSNCHQQNGWEYPVCFSFFNFYQQYGGERQFGKPIAGLEYLDGHLVQFFEYAQLIWMPENPDQARITIAALGYKYFYAFETDFRKLEPYRNYEYNLSISEINVRAFAKQAVIPNGSTQDIYIIAVDQNNAPLSNGIVQVSFRTPDNTEDRTRTYQTDEYGLAKVPLTADSTKPGVVEVVVRVTYNDLEGISVTSFRIWY